MLSIPRLVDPQAGRIPTRGFMRTLELKSRTMAVPEGNLLRDGQLIEVVPHGHKRSLSHADSVRI